jgi:hypothetical protein
MSKDTTKSMERNPEPRTLGSIYRREVFHPNLPDFRKK